MSKFHRVPLVVGKVMDRADLFQRDPAYIPPKKPYSFTAMLDDILHFAAQTLVDHGRLSFWMPTANDKEQAIATPTHPYMVIVSVSTQTFSNCRTSLLLSMITRTS